MSDFRRKAHRILAVVLAFVMVFSIMPLSSIVNAATDAYPDAFTVTVKDGNGAAIDGASVRLSGSDAESGWEYSNSGFTDENGVAAFTYADIKTGLTDVGTISVSVAKEGYESYTGSATVTKDDAASNVDVTLNSISSEPAEITGITLSAKEGLVYTGEAQELVNFDGTVAGDVVTWTVNGVEEDSSDIPERTDAETYTVGVTVERADHNPFHQEVEVTIGLGTITGVDVVARTGLIYTGAALQLVDPSGIQDGDVVTWTVNNGAASENVPMGTAAGEYTVKMTVERANYDIFEKTVTVTISKANVGLDIASKNDLVYNGGEQELLTLSGGWDDDAQVTWTVNGEEETSSAIPKRTEAGEYTVNLTVERENYNKFDKTVTVTIAKAQIEDIEFAPVENLVYNEEEQELVILEGEQEEDDVTFVVNGEAPSSDTPVGEDAGDYMVELTINRGENYNVYTATVVVTIAKAEIEGVEFERIENLVYNGKNQKLVRLDGTMTGDVVTYKVGDEEPSDTIPERTDAGEYKVEVSVKRGANYNEYTADVTVVIAKADITGVVLTPITGLKYNGEMHQLVTHRGTEDGDVVTYKVGDEEPSDTIPERDAVGEYTVVMIVNRGDNYNVLEKETQVTIGLGNIDLGRLTIEAKNRTYDTQEMPLLEVSNVGAYTLEYSTDNQATWVKDTIPTATETGEYKIYVKATKEHYNDKQTDAFPITVTISKADQPFAFDKYKDPSNFGKIELRGPVPYTEYKYDFSADETVILAQNGKITYELADNGGGIAEIAADGNLTVKYPGAITVIAKLSGDSNYNDAEIRYCLNVTGVVEKSGDYIKFAETQKTYVVGTNGGVISEQKATTKDDRINGTISYSINDIEGVAIEADTGKLYVDDIEAFTAEVQGSNNALKIIVTADKAATDLYGADTISYEVAVSFGATPAEKYILPAVDGNDGWYKTEGGVVVTAPDGYTIAKKPSDAFGSSVTFNDQGINERYIYLKDAQTGAMTDKIAVVDENGAKLMLDNIAPDTAKMSIEIEELTIIGKFVQAIEKTLNFGFFNPDVTIKFIIEDELEATESGLDHVEWFYMAGEGATSSILKKTEEEEPLKVVKEDGKYVATLTVPATEAAQYRGHIGFRAYDKANNVSNDLWENDVVVVVDNINPIMDFKHSHADIENGVYNEVVRNGVVQHYYNGSVVCNVTVEEANFFSDDVVFDITKDGKTLNNVEVQWSTDEEDEEIHYGKFTLDAPEDHSGDGDYVVTITYNVKVTEKGEDVVRYTSEVITIDTTLPEVEITYDDVTQIATFKVKEHNFNPNHIEIASGSITDINGKAVFNGDEEFTTGELTKILRKATWTQDASNTDCYMAEYNGLVNEKYVNAIYNLTLNYKDYVEWANSSEATKFIIDHEKPTDLQIEYVTQPIDEFIEIITFGFYKPSVTVRFTAYDTTSGVDYFIWDYTKQEGASTINHPNASPETDEERKIEASASDESDKSKFTAEITLESPEEGENTFPYPQYRGYISASVFDVYGNEGDPVSHEDEYVVVVDTISPTMDIEYTQADRVEKEENTEVVKNYYYNNAVEVKLTITEANFNPKNDWNIENEGRLKISIKKDNNDTLIIPNVKWMGRNENDETIGTFALPAEDHSDDGDYVITVSYTDRSGNPMETYVSPVHTIDTTAPVISVVYENKNVTNTLTDKDGRNRKYYRGAQSAVVTITEHNFDPNEVAFNIGATNVNGTVLGTSVWDREAWESTGDVHTLRINYRGDANYTFDVSYTDKATNAAADYPLDAFTVDKSAPSNLKVAYSTSILETVLETLSFGFYNAKATVTLTAEDTTSEIHAFNYSYVKASGVSDVNAEVVNETVPATNIRYSDDRRTATVSFEIPQAVLGNNNQFNGTVEFTATDRAGNTTSPHKETKRIVVDNIAPTAEVSYNDAVNVIGDVSYYDGDINATIVVTEANFYAEDIKVEVSKDKGPATEITPTWRDRSVDVHEGTFTLSDEGDYVITINYTDKSTNQMTTYTSNQMTIDTTIEPPTISINGKAKTDIGGAYKGAAEITYSFEDRYFADKSIKLTRTRFDKVDDVTDIFIAVEENENGGSGSFTIPEEVANDGIYELFIEMTDKADHKIQSNVKFTINRYGSVYEYSEELIELIKDGGQYKQVIENDLVITEYNADKVLEDSLQILITCDGETVDVDYESSPVNMESGWYEYVYTIKASNFKKDGVYKISLSSKYAADDVKVNDSTSVPENSIGAGGKEILDTMTFTVDTVAPEIRNIINLDQAIPDVDKIVDGKLNVKYTVVDVGGLKSIEIYVNGELYKTVTEEDFAGDRYNFTGDFDLEEQTESYTVQIKVTDLAGNVTDTQSEEFLAAHAEGNENSTFVFSDNVTVSRDFFVRWYANTGLFWGSIAGAGVLVTGTGAAITVRRRKKAAK